VKTRFIKKKVTKRLSDLYINQNTPTKKKKREKKVEEKQGCVNELNSVNQPTRTSLG
jgi:hypothetical protein